MKDAKKSLKEIFGDKAVILGSATGLHLAVRFLKIKFNPGLLKKTEKAGAKVYPVEEHTINKGGYQDTIILGYGMLDTNQIQKGLTKLAEVINPS